MVISLSHDETIYLTEEEVREEIEKMREIIEGKERKIAETLTDLYWNKGMSMFEIAEKFGCTEPNILDLFKKYNIPRRNRNEAIRLAYKKAVESGKIKPPFTKEELIDLYQKQGMSRREIALRKGLTERTVRYWLEKYGISGRSHSEADKLYWEKRKKEKQEGGEGQK
jgi:transposase